MSDNPCETTTLGAVVMLTHDDLVSISIAGASVIFAALTGVMAWLWRHSTRLTGVETRVDAVERTQELDRERELMAWRDLRDRLIRIEDKIDRKVDKA